MTEWLHMGGYGGYVWGAYGVAAGAIAIELWGLTLRRRKALRRAASESGLERAD